MVVEPRVAPYNGVCHIGSCDHRLAPDEEASAFRPTNWEGSQSPTCMAGWISVGESEEDFVGAFTFSDEEAEYINALLEPATMAWLDVQ